MKLKQACCVYTNITYQINH